MSRINRKAAAAARARGHRSGLETRNADHLDACGSDYEYEPFKLPFVQPEKHRTYTPDFVLPNGIVIDTKGLWDTADRQKFKMIKEQHPDLDIRMVFTNPLTKIAKKSQTTYGMYATKIGLPFAKSFIPKEWIDEPPNEASLKVIQQLKI
jgi:hypothetical protein